MGLLGALLGAAPTVLGGVAKGKRDLEQTQYTRQRAEQDAQLQQDAHQQAMAQAMAQFQAQEADRVAQRQQQALQHGDLLKRYEEDRKSRDTNSALERARQEARDKVTEGHLKEQERLAWAALRQRGDKTNTEPKPQRITDMSARKMADLASLVHIGDSSIGDFEAANKAHPLQGVTGLADNALGTVQSYLDVLPKDIQKGRQGIEKVQANIRRMMAGTAFTANEKKVLENFLANNNKGDQYNLEQLRGLVEMSRQQYKDLYDAERMAGRSVEGFYPEIPKAPTGAPVNRSKAILGHP